MDSRPNFLEVHAASITTVVIVTAAGFVSLFERYSEKVKTFKNVPQYIRVIVVAVSTMIAAKHRRNYIVSLFSVFVLSFLLGVAAKKYSGTS